MPYNAFFYTIYSTLSSIFINIWYNLLLLLLIDDNYALSAALSMPCASAS